MRIVMMTNTYLPHVGGVARSVESFTLALRERGHHVTVVAPEFADDPDDEQDVIRVPAIQNFSGSDFAVRLPIPNFVSARLARLSPQLIHSHHPFLMGDTALRAATARDLPLVFTHHTMYERYTHYVPGDSRVMKRFAAEMATQYANMCDQVIAPSRSIAEVLRARGVTTPIEALPTGIDPQRFARGDGAGLRARLGLPDSAWVVGHVGRLAEEKNLTLLCDAVAAFLHQSPQAHFLLVGDGPVREALMRAFAGQGWDQRVHATGQLTGKDVADAYHAMDAFAFASQTETQGMVLAEAMTAGLPVVAVDAPGVREVVDDGANGYLLPHEDVTRFAQTLVRLSNLSPAERRAMSEAARRTAEAFSLERCTDRLVQVYETMIEAGPSHVENRSPWEDTLHRLEIEWNLWSQRVAAAARSATAK